MGATHTASSCRVVFLPERGVSVDFQLHGLLSISGRQSWGSRDLPAHALANVPARVPAPVLAPEHVTVASPEPYQTNQTKCQELKLIGGSVKNCFMVVRLKFEMSEGGKLKSNDRT